MRYLSVIAFTLGHQQQNLRFYKKKSLILFLILKIFVSLQPQNERNLLLGYGVMVTLQILVLSFLVRIQVAQLVYSRF